MGGCSLVPRLLVGAHQEPGYEAREGGDCMIVHREHGRVVTADTDTDLV